MANAVLKPHWYCQPARPGVKRRESCKGLIFKYGDMEERPHQQQQLLLEAEAEKLRGNDSTKEHTAQSTKNNKQHRSLKKPRNSRR